MQFPIEDKLKSEYDLIFYVKSLWQILKNQIQQCLGSSLHEKLEINLYCCQS